MSFVPTFNSKQSWGTCDHETQSERDVGLIRPEVSPGTARWEHPPKKKRKAQMAHAQRFPTIEAEGACKQPQKKKEKRKAISLGVARAGREVPVPIELKTGLQFSRDRDATRRTSHGALVELTQEPLNSLVEQIGHMPA